MIGTVDPRCAEMTQVQPSVQQLIFRQLLAFHTGKLIAKHRMMYGEVCWANAERMQFSVVWFHL
jgi:hypothetical protein